MEIAHMTKTPKRKALQVRSTEATVLLQRLLERLTIPELALRARVSERSVYRWLHEGRAPHPIMLDGLRRLEQELEIEPSVVGDS
jgi:hypothetical protein